MTPPVGYIAGVLADHSARQRRATTAAFSVPMCPAASTTRLPARRSTAKCRPPSSRRRRRSRAAGTSYHVHLLFDDSQVPGSSQIFNNHIPLDPDLQGAAVDHEDDADAERHARPARAVHHHVTTSRVPLFDVRIVDRFPAGFRYVEGLGAHRRRADASRRSRRPRADVERPGRSTTGSTRSCCCSPSARVSAKASS